MFSWAQHYGTLCKITVYLCKHCLVTKPTLTGTPISGSQMTTDLKSTVTRRTTDLSALCKWAANASSVHFPIDNFSFGPPMRLTQCHPVTSCATALRYSLTQMQQMQQYSSKRTASFQTFQVEQSLERWDLQQQPKQHCIWKTQSISIVAKHL